MIPLKIKRKPLVITSILCALVIAVIWFQYSSKATFENVVESNISDANEITDIVIEANIAIIGDTMWTRIEDPLIIEQLMAGYSDISLAKELTKNTRILNHAMTLTTGANSTVFYFDEESFVGNGRDYKIQKGSFIDVVRSLHGDIEWQKTTSS